MRRCLSLTCALLFVPAMLMAQSSGPAGAVEESGPKATIFGGYNYFHSSSEGFNGWQGQGTFNFTPHLGVTADVAGDYRTLVSFSVLGISASAHQRLYTYLFGPTVTGNFGRAAVFGHALFGVAHSSLGAGVNLPIIGGISTGLTSANAFAMAFGGGVDIGVSRHIAVRAVQLDYLRTQFSATDALTTGLSTSLNGGQNSYRASAGIVFRF
jgi:opacity protein-like surface antigen